MTFEDWFEEAWRKGQVTGEYKHDAEMAAKDGWEAALRFARPEAARTAMPWSPEETARRFHAAYEEFAPAFGYVTRQDTREFDPNSQNGRLMIAVVRNVLIEQASSHFMNSVEGNGK